MWIQDLTSPEVADLLAEKPIAVLPVGSIEQHGAHLPCGTDIFAADLVAETLCERLGALCVPLGPYGVTPLHRGHPGTISLRPATLEALLEDVSTEVIGNGAKVLVFLNWHEGNTPSLDRIAIELQSENEVTVIVAQACYTAQRLYAPEGGLLTHGGSIETLAVKAARPELVKLDSVEAVERSERGLAVDAMRRSHEVYGFVTDVTDLDPEGWYGDPHWATDDKVPDFAGRIAAEIEKQVSSILAVRDRNGAGDGAIRNRDGGLS